MTRGQSSIPSGSPLIRESGVSLRNGCEKDMKINSILERKRRPILRKWFELTLEDYPADSIGFFEREKDRFANPVGYTLQSGTEVLYDFLIDKTDFENVEKALDNIVRMRAVQDLAPSQAVSFVFLLKKAVRQELGDDIRKNNISPVELLEYESKIDDLARFSFDIYMKCREKIYELRAGQMTNIACLSREETKPSAEIHEPEDSC